MREIKFRAWDYEEEKMRKVLNMCFDGKMMIHFQYRPSIKKSIDKITLMQSTGLGDKNGEEIYEGDILKLEGKGHEDMLWLVSYEQEGFTLLLTTHDLIECVKRKCPIYVNWWEASTIIGNRYENSELMKHDVNATDSAVGGKS